MALYFLVQMALRQFFPQYFGAGNNVREGIILSMQDATLKDGHHPAVIIKNRSSEELVIGDKCPSPPFDVYYSEVLPVDKTKEGTEGFAPISSDETVMPCKPIANVKPGKSITYELSPWKYSLFGRLGNYRLAAPDDAAEGMAGFSVDFSIREAGPVTKAFRAFITKPLLNLLIMIASFMPDKSLGIAIIILTIIVKLILFIPTQHGLEGQKRMQAIQPKIDALKAQFKNDPQRLQQETLKLWKDHKVNPFQSCLPILIQFPVLIGLFFVIRDGSVLELSRHLLYGAYRELSWSFGTQFLGLNLLEPSKIIMPPLLVIMQFAQMKLTFAIAKRKKESSSLAIRAAEDKKETKEKSPQEMQQKMMLYGLPIMIGVFAVQFPAAVSLYWGVSTVFAIGQQVVVNRKELR